MAQVPLQKNDTRRTHQPKPVGPTADQAPILTPDKAVTEAVRTRLDPRVMTPRNVIVLQRIIGNRALVQELSRQSALAAQQIGGAAPRAPVQRTLSYLEPAKANAKIQKPTKKVVKTVLGLPDAPPEVVQDYSDPHLAAVKARLQGYIKEGNHDFASVEAMYRSTAQGLLADAPAAGAPGDAVPADEGVWKMLQLKLDGGGGVINQDWGELKPGQQKALHTVLIAVNVQISSNALTNAWHKNVKQTLPKKVAPGRLANDESPYVEFLIPGKKKATGIERALYDRESNLVYITDHYDSFVWLRGVPVDVTGGMAQKATAYAASFT